MGSDTKSIDAGPVTRLLIILFVAARRIRFLQRIWRVSPGLLSLFNVYIKVKPYENLAEANAMRLVSQHTSIPIPKMYCAFIHKGYTYTVMSKIKGKMAWHGWQNRSDESKMTILSQLRRFVTELRSVPPPEGTLVGGIDGGPFYDCRLPSKLLWGPYSTIRDFHQALANDADVDLEYADLPGELFELFDFYRKSDNQLVLTHGDLSSLNILVEGDDVVGIVDWETAGWLPSYWEYTCAKNVNPYNAFWTEAVDGFLTPMPNELKMEAIRQKYFGPF